MNEHIRHRRKKRKGEHCKFVAINRVTGNEEAVRCGCGQRTELSKNYKDRLDKRAFEREFKRGLNEIP